ncbi:MAG: PfkB family carbohydrate kinase [Patescibacteria group bacterium]|jgi:sugar/nucleoside kinase (ribokinase family)
MFLPKYQFVTIGGSTRDFMFYDPQANFIFTPQNLTQPKSLCFEYGSKIEIEKTYFTFGGGAANAAVNFSLQGFKTAVITAVGNDENGLAVLNNFKKSGVDISLMEKHAGKMTGFSFILTAGREKEHVIFLYRGANNDLAADVLRGRIKSKWYYLASLSGKKWLAVIDKIFKQKALVAWNPGEQQLKAGYSRLKKYLEKTEIFAVNKDEAIELVLTAKKYKNAGNRLNDIKFLSKAIKAMGPKIVIVTNGRKGGYVYDGKNFYYQKALSREKDVVDTTGVGDCFNSTFVAGWERFGDIKKALAAAGKNSASLTTQVGAQNGLLRIIK